jgi:hypothetical protein
MASVYAVAPLLLQDDVAEVKLVAEADTQVSNLAYSVAYE